MQDEERAAQHLHTVGSKNSPEDSPLEPTDSQEPPQSLLKFPQHPDPPLRAILMPIWVLPVLLALAWQHPDHLNPNYRGSRFQKHP